MQKSLQRSAIFHLAVVLSLVIISILVGQVISGTPINLVIAAVLALAFVLIILVNTDFALAILILSMLLSPEMGAGVVPGREVVVRIDDLLLAVISFTWLAKTAYQKKLALFLKTPLNKPIGIYLLICFISTMRGAFLGFVDPGKGVFYLLRYAQYFLLFFLVANHIYSKKQIKFFLNFLFSTCAIVSVYGILQIPSGRRVSAPFEGRVGEPNPFGGYLLFILCLAVGILLQDVSKKQRHAMFGLCLLIFIPFLFTYSRGSYMALIFALLAFIVLSKRKAELITAAAFAVFFLLLLRPETIFSRVRYTFEGRGETAARLGNIYFDPSSSARIISWKDSIQAWLERPLLGRGITGFTFIDGQYIRTLPELGILGFMALLWLLWTALKSSLDIHKKMEDELYKGLTLGYVAGLIGLSIHAVTSNTFIIIRIMEPFWFLTGIVIMLPALQKEEQKIEFLEKK